jgi:hypothetical protein
MPQRVFLIAVVFLNFSVFSISYSHEESAIVWGAACDSRGEAQGPATAVIESVPGTICQDFPSGHGHYESYAVCQTANATASSGCSFTAIPDATSMQSLDAGSPTLWPDSRIHITSTKG